MVDYIFSEYFSASGVLWNEKYISSLANLMLETAPETFTRGTPSQILLSTVRLEYYIHYIYILVYYWRF